MGNRKRSSCLPSRVVAEYAIGFYRWNEDLLGAKQEATKTRRLEEAIRMLSAGRPLGLK